MVPKTSSPLEHEQVIRVFLHTYQSFTKFLQKSMEFLLDNFYLMQTWNSASPVLLDHDRFSELGEVIGHEMSHLFNHPIIDIQVLVPANISVHVHKVTELQLKHHKRFLKEDDQLHAGYFPPPTFTRNAFSLKKTKESECFFENYFFPKKNSLSEKTC